jgi:phosphonate transport system substrate-binding protein
MKALCDGDNSLPLRVGAGEGCPQASGSKVGGVRDRASGELVFATYLAPNIRPVYEYVTERVGRELDRPARLITGESFDQLREGEVDFAFLCGLPYVRLRMEDPECVEAIAAPVISGERYGGRPTYFSDVIVPSGSDAKSFSDLRGCSWAYNEPHSHSGYLVTLYHLYEMGEMGAFFSGTEMTGFHELSISRVAEGGVDGSAIDSQVLAVHARDHPGLADKVRVIGTLGPSTIQPLVATAAVPDSTRGMVRDVVTRLGTTGADRPALAAGLVERFVAVNDSSYGDIRAMLAAVESAGMHFD